MDFKTLVLSKYQVFSKDELTVPTADLAKGKWFKGQHNRPGFGIYPIPRVKYLGKKNGLYEFMKEDGHPVKISEEEMESERYAFFEDKDQSENLTGYTPPNYSDSSHLDRMQWVKRPFETWTLDCKKASDWMQGSHIAFTLKTASGEDKIHTLMGFQRSCNNLKYLGDKATEAAEHLWKSYGAKIKLGKNLLSMLPLNVESSFREQVEAKYKIIEKLKSWSKNFLRKLITALVLSGMFAGIGAGQALAKDSAEKKTQQFASYMEKLAHKEGKTQLKFIAKSEKYGKSYILHLKIVNKETGGSCSLSVKDPTKVKGLEASGNDELANSWCQDLTDAFTEVAIKTMNE